MALGICYNCRSRDGTSRTSLRDVRRGSPNLACRSTTVTGFLFRVSGGPKSRSRFPLTCAHFHRERPLNSVFGQQRNRFSSHFWSSLYVTYPERFSETFGPVREVLEACRTHRVGVPDRTRTDRGSRSITLRLPIFLFRFIRTFLFIFVTSLFPPVRPRKRLRPYRP